jgi:hypothetical protein
VDVVGEVRLRPRGHVIVRDWRKPNGDSSSTSFENYTVFDP